MNSASTDHSTPLTFDCYGKEVPFFQDMINTPQKGGQGKRGVFFSPSLGLLAPEEGMGWDQEKENCYPQRNNFSVVNTPIKRTGQSQRRTGNSSHRSPLKDITALSH